MQLCKIRTNNQLTYCLHMSEPCCFALKKERKKERKRKEREREKTEKINGF